MHQFLLWGLLPVMLAAQEANRIAPQTRAAEIEAKRYEKSLHLEPDTPSSIDRALQVAKEKKILERITAGVGGVRARLGGLITGSGFAIGPEYFRSDLLQDRAEFRASARASARKSYVMDLDWRMPHLARDHYFLNLYAAHYNYSRVDYYGPGANSSRNGRSVFRLEGTTFEFRTGVKPVRPVLIGALGQYLMVNVGPGVDRRFIETDRIFTEATTAGLQEQTNFLRGGAFLQVDWRDNPGGPRRGGNYVVEIAKYLDRDLRRYTFNRLDLEAQQYIPFFNARRVIALRARTVATDAHSGNRVPFYMQPTLGGSDDLRGFRQFRFYDNASIVLNGEYRWETFSGLDMALFVDAGRVFSRWQEINLRDLETSYGFGFRFNVRNDVFMRIDTGFSREGFAVWFKFGNVF